MRTFMALIVKFALTLGAAAIAGALAGTIDWGLIFMLGLIGTIVNYLVGDLLILPATGNIVASIADGGLAGLLAYFFAVRNTAFAGSVFMFALAFGLIVMVAEFVFHMYLKKDEKVAP